MDIRKVKKLIELLEESGITEIEIKEGEESVRICRGPTVSYQAPPAGAYRTPHVVAAVPVDAAPVQPAGTVVKSPMVGTFYLASSGDTPPFVQIGQQVNVGDTLCIIEAMKIMNPIEAEIAGTVTAVLADNGHPVEYEQPLFIIA